MKCVLTVAGLGTRLLPLTKETPKEMLPIYSKSKKGKLILKPILQVIYESLYEYKINEFCFVTGRTKRAVRDHFKPDYGLVNFLKKQNKTELADTLNDFFLKVKRSHISFIYQPKPIGFGDAIFRSKKFVGNDNYFLLHAGDDIVISKNNDHLRRLENGFLKHRADIALLLEKVKDPSKYGVVSGPYLEKGILQINSMVEKPKNPPSKNAIIAIYLFKPIIFKYLMEAKKTENNPEMQLAKAFNIALERGSKMIGVFLKKDEKRIDVGTPETYSKVLSSIRNIID